MSSIVSKITTMSIQDINKLRINARALLDQPGRYAQASQVLNAIDLELERRYLPGMIKDFLAQNPDGFYGEKHKLEERDYKEEAVAVCQKQLNKEEFQALLDKADYEALNIRASKVINQTNFIQGSFEKPKLIEAIRKSPEVFFTALFDMLWGDGDTATRFGRYIDKLDGLGLNKWTYATYFPFLVDPDNNMFVKPEMLKKSLEKSQYPLDYESTPTVDLYMEILEFSKWLMGKIQSLKPRDMIDIHSFMWHMGPTGKWSEE